MYDLDYVIQMGDRKYFHMLPMFFYIRAKVQKGFCVYY